MAKSFINGSWQVKPTRGATKADDILSFISSFDPTSTSQISLGVLPKGARPLGVDGFGGSTGGSSPTVDVGTVADQDGFATELVSDAVAFNDSGVLTGVLLTTDTEVFGMVGASASTGGTTTVLIKYVMA